MILPKKSSFLYLFSGTSNKVYNIHIWIPHRTKRHLTTSTSHPYIHFQIPVNLGHKGLEFAHHDFLWAFTTRANTWKIGRCELPIARSKCMQLVANRSAQTNPRCTAPLSSCCAIVLAGFVGATRRMACNVSRLPQGWLITPPKTNMEPNNHRIEKENHLPNLLF